MEYLSSFLPQPEISVKPKSSKKVNSIDTGILLLERLINKAQKEPFSESNARLTAYLLQTYASMKRINISNENLRPIFEHVIRTLLSNASVRQKELLSKASKDISQLQFNIVSKTVDEIVLSIKYIFSDAWRKFQEEVNKDSPNKKREEFIDSPKYKIALIKELWRTLPLFNRGEVYGFINNNYDIR